jgi:hypothetical protein
MNYIRNYFKNANVHTFSLVLLGHTYEGDYFRMRM